MFRSAIRLFISTGRDDLSIGLQPEVMSSVWRRQVLWALINLKALQRKTIDGSDLTNVRHGYLAIGYFVLSITD